MNITLDEKQGYSSTVYRKPTNTNVILNMSAFCPFRWKLGLITCFLNRAYVVCSTWSVFHIEVSKLKDIFGQNGYSGDIFEKCVSRFLLRKRSGDDKRDDMDDEKHWVISIPYVGHASDNFKKRLSSFGKDLGITTKVVFNSFRVGSYFSLKEIFG